METIPQLLVRSAMEVRESSASASAGSVGLEDGELEQLSERLMFAARLPPGKADASLAMLSRLFGEQRDIWWAISPAFVELMERLRDPASGE